MSKSLDRIVDRLLPKETINLEMATLKIDMELNDEERSIIAKHREKRSLRTKMNKASILLLEIAKAAITYQYQNEKMTFSIFNDLVDVNYVESLNKSSLTIKEAYEGVKRIQKEVSFFTEQIFGRKKNYS